MCYKTIKKEQNLRNKYVLLASSIREKLAEAKEVRDELCNNKKHKIQKRKSKRNVKTQRKKKQKLFEKSYLNYSLKEPQYSYENKKGRIKYVN